MENSNTCKESEKKEDSWLVGKCICSGREKSSDLPYENSEID